VVRLVVGGGGEVPSRRDAAAGTALACCHINAGRRGVCHRGATQTEGEPRPGNRTPPIGAVAVLTVIACVAKRRARPVVVLSTPVESADRSVDGVEVLKGPQRLLGRAPGYQQQVQRGPVLARSAAASEVRRGW
jgi:hypothetical protein